MGMGGAGGAVFLFLMLWEEDARSDYICGVVAVTDHGLIIDTAR